jgi:molecular chaperone DnaK
MAFPLSQYVGIDLGTSTSALAYIREDGNPEIVPNSDGERLMPSVVFFDQFEGVKLVGSTARDGGDPDRTIQHIKRHMDDPEYFVVVDGVKWSPTEVSSIILAKLKRDCSETIGEIKDVVITVPAKFNELARRATFAAGQLAGLNVVQIVNEPTAAALYYVHSKHISGRVMVFDLGGGSLDITILDINGEHVNILLAEGARHLGGYDIDELLVAHFGEEFKKQNGHDLIQSNHQHRRLLAVAEDGKKKLSKLNTIAATFGTDQEGLTQIQLTRPTFEAIIRRLLTRSMMLVEQSLDSLGLAPGDIDHVLLVGGSTRIPRVAQLLEHHFGKKPLSCGNVDECVALGAALFAKKSLKVTEVCNHSYGTLALIENAATGEAWVQNLIVIPKNTPIPCSMSQVFQTSDAGERYIEVEITQGEDSDPRYVDVIGKIMVEVPPNRPVGTSGFALKFMIRFRGFVTMPRLSISGKGF